VEIIEPSLPLSGDRSPAERFPWNLVTPPAGGPDTGNDAQVAFGTASMDIGADTLQSVDPLLESDSSENEHAPTGRFEEIPVFNKKDHQEYLGLLAKSYNPAKNSDMFKQVPVPFELQERVMTELLTLPKSAWDKDSRKIGENALCIHLGLQSSKVSTSCFMTTATTNPIMAGLVGASLDVIRLIYAISNPNVTIPGQP